MEDIINIYTEVLNNISEKDKIDKHIKILSGKTRSELDPVRKSDVGYVTMAIDHSLETVSKYYDKKMVELKLTSRTYNNQLSTLDHKSVECDNVRKLERDIVEERFDLEYRYNAYLSLADNVKLIIDYTIGNKKIRSLVGGYRIW